MGRKEEKKGKKGEKKEKRKKRKEKKEGGEKEVINELKNFACDTHFY